MREKQAYDKREKKTIHLIFIKFKRPPALALDLCIAVVQFVVWMCFGGNIIKVSDDTYAVVDIYYR